MGVAFQRVPPRHDVDAAKALRSVCHRLRAFYAPPGSGRGRHHLGVVALPADAQETDAFLRQCAARLAQLGAAPEEVPRFIHRIQARVAAENVQEAHNERARAEVKDHLLRAALALAGLESVHETRSTASPRVQRGRGGHSQSTEER